jgi:hypothetical protein
MMSAMRREACHSGSGLHIPPPPPAFFRSKSSSILGGHVGLAGLLSVKLGLFWGLFLPFSTSLLSFVAALAGGIMVTVISGAAYIATVKSRIAYLRMRFLPGCFEQASVGAHAWYVAPERNVTSLQRDDSVAFYRTTTVVPIETRL